MEHTAGRKNIEKMTATERILVFALVTAPFTSLRFSFFGLSEIFFILMWITVMFRSRFRLRLEKDNITKWFLVFVLACIIGWAFNIFTVDIGTTRSAVFNFAAYVFTLIAIAITEHLQCVEPELLRPRKVLKAFFIWLCLISFVLFALSRFRKSIFGFNLIYYDMFCPLSDNIHQFAMSAVPLPFIGLSMVKESKSWGMKIIYLAMSIAEIFIVLATGSFKAGLGISIGIFVLFILLVINSKKLSKSNRNIIIILAFTAVIVFAILKSNLILKYMQRVFTENDNGGERGGLYRQSIQLILRYPLFGLGPAAVLTYGSSYFDAHQTLFTAGLSAGVFGLVSVTVILIKCVKTTIKNSFYFCALIPILIYAIGGDILRKTAVWACIMLLYFGTRRESVTAVSEAASGVTSEAEAETSEEVSC